MYAGSAATLPPTVILDDQPERRVELTDQALADDTLPQSTCVARVAVQNARLSFALPLGLFLRDPYPCVLEH